VRKGKSVVFVQRFVIVAALLYGVPSGRLPQHRCAVLRNDISALHGIEKRKYEKFVNSFR